ncbi:MAG: hypothetical protein HAW61_01825, partial [Candidatus Portiera sp.]|nr:hypothetical protein [Portiera sp.]
SFSNSLYTARWNDFRCDPITKKAQYSLVDLPDSIAGWDLGESDEYPALNCSPFTLAEQRAKAADIFLD